MNKRKFLQTMLATGSVVLANKRYSSSPTTGDELPALLLPADQDAADTAAAMALEEVRVPPLLLTTPQEEFQLATQQARELSADFHHGERMRSSEMVIQQLPNEAIDQYLEKIRNFDANFSNDIYLDDIKGPLLVPTLSRLDRVQSLVGHANFNLLSFGDMQRFAHNYAEIGKFTAAELAFIEEVFYANANNYGFFGDKVTAELNHQIAPEEVEKIEGTGHYLFKGESLNHYLQIYKDVGNELTLTSGVRNNVKQLHLFLAKTLQARGNLSRASRSLAPPGYSFHGIGDFDVGKVGLGEQNFTSDFSNTTEYQRLMNLGYVDIRYTDDNMLGVRYEPWHIKLG